MFSFEKYQKFKETMRIKSINKKVKNNIEPN